MPESLVLLHGFSGTRHAWDGVAAQLSRNAICRWRSTCPGTATRPSRTRRSASTRASRTCSHDSPERFALCGYSLGGRVALHVALAAPERVTRLVLVSTSAGIEGSRPSAPSAARPIAASPTSSNGFPSSSSSSAGARSRCSPTIPPRSASCAREDQRRNRPDALAAVLRGHRHGGDGAAVGSAGRADDARHRRRRRARREVPRARRAHGGLIPQC